MQEYQLDKYCQELSSPSAITNVTQTKAHMNTDKNTSIGNTDQYFHDQGRSSRSRECGHQTYLLGNRPTCQLRNIYGNSTTECWHKFDEYFELVPPKPQD